MIYDGALAADGVLHTGSWVWCLVIGALIVLWIFIGITNLGKINTIAMAALFILTLVLCKLIFFDGGTALAIGEEAMSFGAAVELSVAMPLSWLPLISDYTREAKEPVKATAVSAIIYGLVSCWMYVIGMGAAIYTGESDIAQIMVKAGLGIAGLLIIVFSTVTTTFLDAYSAGICIFQDQWKICGHCSDCDWNHRRHCLSNGQYYRFPVPYWFRVCTYDCHPDCRFLPAQTRRQPGRGR